MEENIYFTEHYGKSIEFSITGLEEKAEKGDVESQIILGDFFYDYIDGDLRLSSSPLPFAIYPPLDINKAIFWFSKAADLGSDTAQQKLAVCQGDVAKLQSALEKAEKHLDAETALFIGECYAYGHCAPVDDEEALKWLQKAVKLHCFDALYPLAYNKGFFNQADEDKKACVDLFLEDTRIKNHTLDFDASNSNDKNKYYTLAYSVYGKEYMEKVLAELANDNDIDALCRLGCYHIGQNSWEEEWVRDSSIATRLFLHLSLWYGLFEFKYFSYLPKYFRHGIVVDRDSKMAEILERCIANIKEEYKDPDFYDSEDGTERLCCSYCNDDDRRYIFEWLRNATESDSPVKEEALIYLEYFYRYGYGTSIDKLKARQQLIEYIRLTKGEGELSYGEINCVPHYLKDGTECLDEQLEKLSVSEYASFYKKQIQRHHYLAVCLAHLYEYGFSEENIDGVKEEDMDDFQKMYALALKLREFKDAKLRCRFLCQSLRDGNLASLAFLDNDPFLIDEPVEVKLDTIQFIWKNVRKVHNPLILSLFDNLFSQYFRFDRSTMNSLLLDRAECGDDIAKELLSRFTREEESQDSESTEESESTSSLEEDPFESLII